VPVSAEAKVMKIKTTITGATGMVGEGVVLECLDHPDVEQVLVINRKPGGVSHPKLREIIHIDFFNLAPTEQQLSGFNACFFVWVYRPSAWTTRNIRTLPTTLR
jgi:N-acetyl-gamma-glutamylphosphate reductase